MFTNFEGLSRRSVERDRRLRLACWRRVFMAASTLSWMRLRSFPRRHRPLHQRPQVVEASAASADLLNHSLAHLTVRAGASLLRDQGLAVSTGPTPRDPELRDVTRDRVQQERHVQTRDTAPPLQT